MKTKLFAVIACSVLLSSCSSYMDGTLTEFVQKYDMAKHNCVRYANYPTYVYTCSDEDSLVIRNEGQSGQYMGYCAYWDGKRYCSKGTNVRW